MNDSQLIQASSRQAVVFGLATIIFGILAMFMPLFSGLTVTALVGVLMIAAGITRTIFAFKAESFGKGILVFLFGGISIVCGVIILIHPLLGLATLTLVLAAYFLVDGIFEIIAAFKLRGQRGWFWMLISGISSIVLAYLMWSQWPFSGQWAIGILVGVRLLFAGWGMIALGSAGEEVSKMVKERS